MVISPLTIVNMTAWIAAIVSRLQSAIIALRGKHKIAAMSDIVIELKRRNWTTERICNQLGMDDDEVLRLCQITGLADLFTDQEFSLESWDVEGEITESDPKELDRRCETYGEEIEEFRTVNTSDDSRIFHQSSAMGVLQGRILCDHERWNDKGSMPKATYAQVLP